MTTMSSSRDAARSCVHFGRWNSDATFSFARLVLQVIASVNVDLTAESGPDGEPRRETRPQCVFT